MRVSHSRFAEAIASELEAICLNLQIVICQHNAANSVRNLRTRQRHMQQQIGKGVQAKSRHARDSKSVKSEEARSRFAAAREFRTRGSCDLASTGAAASALAARRLGLLLVAAVAIAIASAAFGSRAGSSGSRRGILVDGSSGGSRRVGFSGSSSSLGFLLRRRLRLGHERGGGGRFLRVVVHNN